MSCIEVQPTMGALTTFAGLWYSGTLYYMSPPPPYSPLLQYTLTSAKTYAFRKQLTQFRLY